MVFTKKKKEVKGPLCLQKYRKWTVKYYGTKWALEVTSFKPNPQSVTAILKGMCDFTCFVDCNRHHLPKLQPLQIVQFSMLNSSKLLQLHSKLSWPKNKIIGSNTVAQRKRLVLSRLFCQSHWPMHGIKQAGCLRECPPSWCYCIYWHLQLNRLQ